MYSANFYTRRPSIETGRGPCRGRRHPPPVYPAASPGEADTAVAAWRPFREAARPARCKPRACNNQGRSRPVPPRQRERRPFVWHPARLGGEDSCPVPAHPSGTHPGDEMRGAARRRSRNEASPAGFSAILVRGPAQNRPRFGWFQDGVREGLRLARRQDQHAAPLDRPFGGRLGAMNDEIGHGAAFQIGRALDENLLFLVEARIEAIGLWRRRSPRACCRLAQMLFSPATTVR